MRDGFGPLVGFLIPPSRSKRSMETPREPSRSCGACRRTVLPLAAPKGKKRPFDKLRACPRAGGGRPAYIQGLLVRARRTRTDHARRQDRKRVVKGKSVSVRVDTGGRRIIKKHTTT